MVKFGIQVSYLGYEHESFVSKLATWGGLVKAMISSVPEGAYMMEALTADGCNSPNMFILLAGEIVECKLFVLDLGPCFKK